MLLNLLRLKPVKLEIFNMAHGKNIMVILSSPSGVGKTTLTKKFNKNINHLKSQFHTTRKPRSNEVNGVDYHFVSHQEFEKLIQENKFYEYAKILRIIMAH